MTDAALSGENEKPKSGKLPLIIGLVLALAGGGGGFYATHSGLILAPESSEPAKAPEEKPDGLGDVAFVPLEPLMISLPPSSRYKHLRFRGELEVPRAYKADVELVSPRIIDILNGYLRALEISDIEEPASLTRLRSQMLRRVQVVAGPGRVRDLLVMEFVLN